MTPDMINGSFEFVGGLSIFNHCRVVLEHKEVKGVSVLSTIFFLSWSVWNVFFFPHMELWFSFYGGLFMLAANVLWVGLLIKYYRK